ncbi:TetR/AcrR family transcriptional regulator [Lysobacter niabensis]|uniref:TetR/AcrR family transcriptional regulator n=1 Tax=Agrilutibacter niabensis TaxID=380628 RepID=UPI00361D6DB4
MDAGSQGRPNQRRRTRKDLLQAATRLVRQGRKPSLEEVAEEAMVSRATAYRYFPKLEPLLLEAALDVVVPEADVLLERAPKDDAVARMECVDDALHDMILSNEAQLRTMLVHSLQRGIGSNEDALPARQNRRSPLIEAALAPVRRQFRTAALKHLPHALALVIGTEAMVVCKDVLQLDDAEARKVKRWAIRALIEAARKPAGD